MKGLKCLASKEWWNAAGTRALKTFAQTFVALVGTSVVIQDVGWPYVLSGSALAAILSLATSLGGIPEVGGAAGSEGTD
jgi:hypothetical protein